MNHIPLHLVRQIISSYVHDHLENLRGVVLNPVASTPAFGDLRVVVLNPVASTPAFSDREIGMNVCSLYCGQRPLSQILIHEAHVAPGV